MSLPDLTAGAVTPTVAAAGVAVTLSAPVTNQGSGATGGSFTDLFEINPDNIPATFDGIKTLRTYASAALAAGKGNAMSVSYAFAAAGTYYVRACADTDILNNTDTPKNSTGEYQGAIAESDEDNNCSPSWTKVTVSATASSYPDLTASAVRPTTAAAPSPNSALATRFATAGSARCVVSEQSSTASSTATWSGHASR